MDLKLAGDKALEFLKNYFKDIEFKVEIDSKGEFIEVTNNALSLTGHKGILNVALQLTKGGIAFFCLTFGKIEKNAATLELVNQFNADNPFYKAYIHSNGHLALENNVAIYTEEEFGKQAVEFMYRGKDLSQDENLLALTNLISDENVINDSEMKN